MISIIIPVYNVKKYLKDCLDGILMQTYTDWECILVDDGSKDGSAEICDSYALRDARFKVIHKENGGVSSARNMGLKEARGEWVAFVDADDMISPRYLTSLIESSEEGDDLIVGGNRYFGLEEGKTVPPKNTIIQREDFKYLIFTDTEWTWQHVFYVVWGKLFRLSIIKENDLLFDTNLVISEDTIFLLTYMTHISLMRMVVTSEYLYRYENSIKSYYHFKIDKLIKQQSAFEKAMAKIESRNIGDLTQLKTLSKSLCFNKYLMSLKDRRAFISGINAYKKYDDNYLSMFGDFKHKIYYYLIFSCPFLGYYIKKHLKK